MKRLGWMMVIGLGALSSNALAANTERAYLGLELLALTPELRGHFGGDTSRGILVARLTDDGPAAQAGIAVGDLVVEVNGQSVVGFGEVVTEILKFKPGETLQVTVVRDGQEKNHSIELGQREGPQVIRLGPAYWRSGEPMPPTSPELKRVFKNLRKNIQYMRMPSPGQPLPVVERQGLEQRLRELESKLQRLESRLGEQS